MSDDDHRPQTSAGSRHSDDDVSIRLSKSKSAKSARSRANKIYRTPVTPTPDEQLTKEKTFVLDCNAASSISRDYCKANPKLGPVIPPYNAQRDKHVGNYFKFYGVDRTLKRTGQVSSFGEVGHSSKK